MKGHLLVMRKDDEVVWNAEWIAYASLGKEGGKGARMALLFLTPPGSLGTELCCLDAEHEELLI